MTLLFLESELFRENEPGTSVISFRVINFSLIKMFWNYRFKFVFKRAIIMAILGEKISLKVTRHRVAEPFCSHWYR